jgi:hypothetical protein
MTAFDVFRMPTPVSVLGRSSSITNSFINGIIPNRYPTEEDVAEALTVPQLDPDDLRCAYCGDKATEWDHLRPLISGQEPTGYISEIQNLVPACGKCNQSKGNSHWRSWMEGNAKLCPRVRCILDLDDRIARLELFEKWREPTRLNIPEMVGSQLWAEYRANWRDLLDAMRQSQVMSQKLKSILNESVDRPVRNLRSASIRVSPRLSSDTLTTADDRSVIAGRIREWASKPHLNVHRIIGIVLRAEGVISRDELVKEAQRITNSKNAYGAIASLLTSKGNAYGQVFEDTGGTIRIRKDLEETVRKYNWS